MQEWTCAATCDNGKQQRVSRVQTPRHFVHPWIICGAMPNASTAAQCGEPFNMHAPAGRSYIRACTVHSRPKTAAHGHSHSLSDDNNIHSRTQRVPFTRNFFPNIFLHSFPQSVYLKTTIVARKSHFSKANSHWTQSSQGHILRNK